MIETTALKFQYNQTAGFDFKPFTIAQGQHVFIFGESGSGKTTLLHLLSGVLNAQQGSISIDKENITELSNIQKDQFRRDHMGYVFQQFNLLPYLNIQENIELPLKLSKKKQHQNTIETDTILDQIGLKNMSQKKTKHLSQGQKQRVAIARAMMGNPKVILADEPTSSLDTQNTDSCMQMLKATQATVIMISHDLSLKKHFDRCIDLQTLLEN